MICGLVISAITSLLLLVNPSLTAKLVDEVIVAQNPEPLLGILVIMLVVKLGREGARYTMIVMLEKASQNTIFTLRRELFSRLQYQDTRFFDRNRTGDLMTRMSADLDWCRHFISYMEYSIVDCVFMFLRHADPLLLRELEADAVSGCRYAGADADHQGVFRQGAAHCSSSMRERLSEMNTAAQENIAGNRVVRAFAREKYRRRKL